MTWWAPFTFVAGTSLAAEDVNKYLYDNMNETLIGKLKSGGVASSEGVWFSSDGPNSVVGREIKSDNATGFGVKTTSTSTYGVPNSTSGGYSNPSLTVTTGTNALVVWNGMLSMPVSPPPAATVSAFCSIAVSGATSISANDTYAIRSSGNVYAPNDENTVTGGLFSEYMTFRWYTSLTPGNNTFTMHIRCSSNGTPVRMDVPALTVIPFG